MYIGPVEEKLCSNAGLKNQAQVDFQAIRMALFGLVVDIFFFRSNTTFMQEAIVSCQVGFQGINSRYKKRFPYAVKSNFYIWTKPY